MNKNKKIGLIFILIGVLIIPLFYFIASREGFVITAMLGLMAIVFGGFQLILANAVNARPANATKVRKAKKSH